MKISRRNLVKCSLALAAQMSAGPGISGSLFDLGRSDTGAFYVPGYRPHRARCQGRPLSHHPDFTSGIPDGYQGPRTMVSRLQPGGRVVRRVFPLKGHQITVSTRYPLAFFNSIDHPQMVVFDRDSLEFERLIQPHASGYNGGGHALFHDDGCCLINTERRAMTPYGGRAAAHNGAIVIRDPFSMQVLTAYSCHGINPHEIRMIDANTAAISNYGSTGWPADRPGHPWPFVVEPSVTLIDIRDGALVDKFVAPDRSLEIRHLAADRAGGILAIQTRLLSATAEGHFRATGKAVYEADDTVDTRLWFAPAPLFSIQGAQGTPVALDNPMDQRQGQSILYDPRHDEFLVTYTSSHRIAVIDAGTRAVKQVIASDRLGLHYPRGIQLLPDGKRYAVSGSWRNLHLFHRGTHSPDPQGVHHETWFGHSHLTVI